MGNIFYYKGKVLSVNKWHGARAIFNKFKNRWTAMIYATTDYKNYKKKLIQSFLNAPKITGYVDMQLTVCLPLGSDTGNIEKAAGDALEEAGIIENDKFVRNINILRHYHPGSGSKNKYDDYLIIELTEVPEEDLKTIKYQQKNDVFELKL